MSGGSSVRRFDKRRENLAFKNFFQQNRSVSQVMRFAIKKYLDLITNPMESHWKSFRRRYLSRLAIQIARNADILNAMQIILFEAKIFKQDQPFQICYFSDNIGKITGYDRFDLLDHDFLQSHHDDQSESIFQPTQQSKWERVLGSKSPMEIMHRPEHPFLSQMKSIYLELGSLSELIPGDQPFE